MNESQEEDLMTPGDGHNLSFFKKTKTKTDQETLC